MLLLANNINSFRRESLGNKSPDEVTIDKSILRLMEPMGHIPYLRRGKLNTVFAEKVTKNNCRW